MPINVSHNALEDITIYTVSISIEEEVSVIMDQLLQLIYSDVGFCAIIFDLKGAKPLPQAKSRNKTLVELILNKPKYICTVIVNADIFMKMIVNIVEKALVFRESETSLKKTFFVKSLLDAEKLIHDNLLKQVEQS